MVPTIAGQQSVTVTLYLGSSCTGKVAYVVVLPTAYCYTNSGCGTTSSGMSYTYTCSGVTKGSITTGYVAATATYATCSAPTSVVYYPVGQCLNSGKGGAIFTADVSPSNRVYYAAYSDTSCTESSRTASYAYPSTQCQATAGGLTSSFTYLATAPVVSGASQTVQYFTGSSCTDPTKLKYGYTVAIAAGNSCYSQPCTTDSAGNSYVYTCSGTGGSPTPYPSSMPIVAGTPTAAPTVEATQAMVKVSLSLTLNGIDVTGYNSNPALQSQLKTILAQSFPGVTPSSIVLTGSGISSIGSRRSLQPGSTDSTSLTKSTNMRRNQCK